MPSACSCSLSPRSRRARSTRRTTPQRRDLPPKPALQRAIGALITKEIVGRDPDGAYRIIEPFFADWLLKEQAYQPSPGSA